ncbi:MAG: hypothetical protein ACT4OX_06255 [Actinomycetota bacterium]
MTAWDDRTLVEDVLANGVDDWVYAAWVHQIARRSGITDPSQLRQLSIGLIAELLVRGLMVAGEYDGVAHRPWECSTGEAIDRIVEEWQTWGDDFPTPGAIVWLDLTPAGREIAEAVLAREQAT